MNEEGECGLTDALVWFTSGQTFKPRRHAFIFSCIVKLRMVFHNVSYAVELAA